MSCPRISTDFIEIRSVCPILFTGRNRSLNMAQPSRCRSSVVAWLETRCLTLKHCRKTTLKLVI